MTQPASPTSALTYRAVRTAARWRARLLSVASVIGLAGAAVWVERFNPTDNVADPTGPCVWHALTGINGPTCGGTRAFYELIHGNLIEAARFHLPFVVAVPVLLYWWCTWAAQAWFGWRLPRLRLPAWVIVAYAVAALVFTTVLRNLPYGPFAWFDIPNMTHRI